MGLQLPAAQLESWEPMPGPKGRNGLREVWAMPGVQEKKEGKGLPGAYGLPLLGRPWAVRKPHRGCGRKGPRWGSREDRMDRAVWSGVPLTG